MRWKRSGRGGVFSAIRWLVILSAAAVCGLPPVQTSSQAGGRLAPPPSPQRIICASPAIGEMVFALGAQERVVGVSAFSEFPPAIQAKPVFGSALEPNRERLLRLKPDLILAQGKSAALAEFAQAHGMAFLSYPLDSVADIRAAIRGIADVLGAEAEAARLLRELEEALAAPAPETAVPVFIALGHSPGDFSALMTAGPGTFLDEWVTLAGGSNIFSDVAAPWPPISLEVLIRRKPVVILDLQHAPPSVAEQQALRADWERMGFGKERIRLLSEAALLRPGVRMAKALQALRAALHSSE